jgi:chemotaxis protein MotB
MKTQKHFTLPSYILLIIIVLTSTIGFESCVPPKKMKEIQSNYDKCEQDRKTLSGSLQKLETENNELKANGEQLRTQVSNLKEDTVRLSKEIERTRSQYDKLNKLNDELLKKQAAAVQGSEAENQRLLAELQANMDKLLEKEDALKLMEGDLVSKIRTLDRMTAELEEREKKVQELQKIIEDKDAAVANLKKKVQDALLNFEGKGLTVEQKNGRIYVSMEAKLLFASGSWTINTEGRTVLTNLAVALESVQNITILVEGHTDSDAFNGSGQVRDNWDLSVMRATNVVKFMLQSSKINPAILTAAGRGEFMPVDTGKSAEAKAKNRRIEIILTPNLDQLFNLLNE